MASISRNTLAERSPPPPSQKTCWTSFQKIEKKSFPSYSTCKVPETGVYVLEAKSLPGARDKM
jgi:hypothetical protein